MQEEIEIRRRDKVNGRRKENSREDVKDGNNRLAQDNDPNGLFDKVHRSSN